jgi:hypothetical protein
MTLSRNQQFNIRHNVFMALMSAEKSGMGKNEIISVNMAESLHADANTISTMIADEYASKNGGGALWLNRQLKNGDWLAEIQEKSWLIQRNK